MKLSRFARLALAVASGALLALAYPSFNLPILAWVAIALLLVSVIGASLPYATLLGFLHGAIFCLLTMPWIYTVMRVQGGIARPAAAGTMAAFTFVLSLFPAAFASAMAERSRRGIAQACLTAPVLWVVLEYAKTHMPYIGFPWNLLGYPASENLALVQITAWTGIWGLSFVVAGYNALLAWAVVAPPERKKRARQMAAAATVVLILAALAGPSMVPKVQAHHTARLVQMNFPEVQNYPQDWMALNAAEMEEIERLSLAPGKTRTDLVVWPEVPAPFYMQDPAFAQRARRIAEKAGADFLFGVVDWRAAAPGGPLLAHNSAVLLHAAPGHEVTYDKMHLVAFGEYVPLRRWLKFAEKLTADIGNFTPGTDPTVGLLANGGREGTFICFEAVFPDLVRKFIDSGAELFINISNDGWLGGTAGPAQHLMIARVRAVENRRWLLRDTNSGYTVSVDPYGRIVTQLAPDVRGALDAPYDFRTDRTLYTWLGDWLPGVCVGLSGLFMLIGGRRKSVA